MKAARRAGRQVAGRPGCQGMSERATMSRQEWKKRLRGQKSRGARKANLAAEGWGAEEKPRTSRRRGRAGKAAALKSKKRFRQDLWK